MTIIDHEAMSTEDLVRLLGETADNGIECDDETLLRMDEILCELDLRKMDAPSRRYFARIHKGILAQL